MPVSKFVLDLNSPDQTTDFARMFAASFRRGDCLLLEGPIGAGKTHFARAVIQARLAAQGLAEDVPSPTFTLVQTYDTRSGELWHADLYRLTSPEEVEELGLTEAFETAICLVEWPDRLGEMVPKNALRMEFQAIPGNDDGRRVVMSGGDRWLERLQGLHDA